MGFWVSHFWLNDIDVQLLYDEAKLRLTGLKSGSSRILPTCRYDGYDSVWNFAT